MPLRWRSLKSMNPSCDTKPSLSNEKLLEKLHLRGIYPLWRYFFDMRFKPQKSYSFCYSLYSSYSSSFFVSSIFYICLEHPASLLQVSFRTHHSLIQLFSPHFLKPFESDLWFLYFRSWNYLCNWDFLLLISLNSVYFFFDINWLLTGISSLSLIQYSKNHWRFYYLWTKIGFFLDVQDSWSFVVLWALWWTIFTVDTAKLFSHHQTNTGMTSSKGIFWKEECQCSFGCVFIQAFHSVSAWTSTWTWGRSQTQPLRRDTSSKWQN